MSDTPKQIVVTIAAQLEPTEIIAATAERCFFCGEKVGWDYLRREGDAPEVVEVYRLTATHHDLYDVELGVCHIACGDARFEGKK